MDVDYFIASPSETPRHTLRYGGIDRSHQRRISQYQDLLHLQLPGDGAYYAALFPRPHGEAPLRPMAGRSRIRPPASRSKGSGARPAARPSIGDLPAVR